jgi:hypothetical protein
LLNGKIQVKQLTIMAPKRPSKSHQSEKKPSKASKDAKKNTGEA